MIFLLAICAFQGLSKWKQFLILITAFTIGHSLSLLVAVFDLIPYSVSIIEFLIPLTIFIYAIQQLIFGEGSRSYSFKYVIVLLFGLIHGLGFSSYLKSLLGNESDLIIKLFAFNIGIELGQILVVSIIIFIKTLVDYSGLVKRQNLEYWISGMATGIAILLMNQTKFW